MSWQEIESVFNRAWLGAFSRKKILFTIPALLCCGLLGVFFSIWGARAGEWQSVSMLFLPLFFSASVLLSLGVVLVRIYYHEARGSHVSYRGILRDSKKVMVDIAYLGLPLILAYLLLWTVLGVFYLCKELPVVGEGLGVVLSFGPFLLLLGCFVLLLISAWALFFVTPLVALRASVQWEVLREVVWWLKRNPFSSAVLWVLGVIPLGVVTGLIWLAASLTQRSYILLEHPLAIGVQWLFMLLPFAVCTAPAVIFFFHFSLEAHRLIVKRQSSGAA